MPKSIAIVYNETQPSYYDKTGEKKAVLSVLSCVDAVQQALLKRNYTVTVVPLSPPRESLRKTLDSLDADLVFNLFEGFPGEPETETLVPGILSEIGKPYTGCLAATLRTALDKFGVKKSLRATGIPTPDFQLLSPQKIHLFRLSLPCIVKPSHEDASHGITPVSVVNDISSLQERVKTVFDNYHNQALVEEFIGGEIVYTLPPGMPPILTFEAKWEPDSVYYKNTQVVCPAKITAKERESIRKTALAAYRLLGCSGYARVDMRMDSESVINVIEVNPNPDISPGAGVALQAVAAGMNYTQLVEKIIKLALDRGKYESKNTSYISFRQNRLITNIKKHTRI